MTASSPCEDHSARFEIRIGEHLDVLLSQGNLTDDVYRELLVEAANFLFHGSSSRAKVYSTELTRAR